jgi:hypothetical protein
MIVDGAIHVDGRRTAEALTRQKFRETNLLERTRVVGDPSRLPAVVGGRIEAHRRE